MKFWKNPIRIDHKAIKLSTRKQVYQGLYPLWSNAHSGTTHYPSGELISQLSQQRPLLSFSFNRLTNYHYVVVYDMPLSAWSISFPPAQVSLTAHS